MPLVGGDTDKQGGGSSSCSLAKVRVRERHKRTCCTSTQGIPEKKKEKSQKSTHHFGQETLRQFGNFSPPPHRPSSVTPL